MGLLLSLVLPLIPVIILLVLVGVALDVILRDWMLPHYALEDATAGEAWEEVWDRITAEKRQFAVYALLRLILPVIAMIGLFIVLLIPGLMVAGAVAAIVYAIHSAFADATGVSVAGRHPSPGLLRSRCIRLRAAGRHLPWRALEHRRCASMR